MKIAFLSFYSGRANRGVETLVSELADRLKKHHELKVFSSQNSLTFQKYRPGWRFYLDRQSLEIKKFTQEVLQKMDEDTDIVIPVNGGWQSLLVRFWTWQHRKKMVISGQSGKGWDDRINLLCRPDVFVALTNYQRNWAKKWGFGVRVEKIPNGVDLEKFSPNVVPANLNLPKPVVVCVAAMEKDKGIDLAIKAVAKLPQASFLLVSGGGTEQKNLETLATKLLPNRHLFLPVAHDKIPAYYAAANLLTMAPHYSESFGIVYLEALATNLPVVASDDPTRQEIVGKAGLFVDPQDTDKYAAALQKALESNWGNAPRLQAEKFSWDKIIASYEALFQSLIPGRIH